MYSEDFTNSSAGQCIRTIGQPAYWAYVPNPLPPKIEVDWELVRLLSRAESKLGELSRAEQLLPDVYRLIRPLFIRRESVTSSRIENTQSGLNDLFRFEANGTEPSPVSDVKEVINYVKAMEYGIKRLEDLPISSRLICEIHGILMEGVRGESATPGEMRRRQNCIGSPGCTVMDATYVPPPLPEMKECFSDLEKYINSDAKEPALIQCALVHYQFEAIHPFLDGNGRIGRLLVTFMLLEKNLLSQPLLYLSDFFEQYRDEYHRLLLNVSQKGDWKAWLTFFLNGIRQQSEDTLATIQELRYLPEQYREVATGQRVPKTVTRLIDHLFTGPIVSISQLSKTWKMPFPTVKRGVDYLVEEGILEEITKRRRNRLFVAHEIYYIIMAERTKSMNPGETSNMSETVVGLSDLPDGWKVKTFGEVTDIFKGGTPKRNVERYFQGDIAWATPTDITKLDGALYIDDTATHISKEALGKSAARLLPAGTVLLTSRATIGKVAIANVPMATNQGFANFLCKEEIENIFLAYYLRSITDLLISLGGGTTFLEVTKTTLLDVGIPLPPLPEQHRIVAKIEELFTKLDAGIDALHKVQAQLKRYRQSVLKAAFEGKLTETWRAEHQDEIEPVSPDASDLPDGWVWTNLEDVSELNPRIDKQSIDDDLEITFLPMKCVEELTGKIDLSETKQFSEVKRKSYTPFRDGDILFAKVTPCMENGKIAIAHDLKNGIGFGSTEFHVVRSLEEQSTQFFFFYFIQQKFRQDAKRAMTSAVGLLRVPTDYMRKVLIPLPALAEQQAIVSEVERRLSVANQVEKTVATELKRAEQLRQSILKQAFSGGLVPQDPNDEPASVLLERIREEKS